MKDQPLTASIQEFPTISRRFSYSLAQVENGIEMFALPDSQMRKAIEQLKAQETHGPIAKAKDQCVVHGNTLVFCEQPSEAYTALYYWTAGFLDAIFAFEVES